jgi:hypothetical protein
MALCLGAFSREIVTELIAMRLATPRAALKMLTALASFFLRLRSE